MTKERMDEINQIYQESLNEDKAPTFGQRLSDKVAQIYGSWIFVAIQSTIILFWIIWNQIPGVFHFDPPPFILLNLILSFIAGYTGSFLQMSSNRQASRDRLIFEHDYLSDLRSEKHIEKIHNEINELRNDINNLSTKLSK